MEAFRNLPINEPKTLTDLPSDTLALIFKALDKKDMPNFFICCKTVRWDPAVRRAHKDQDP